MTLAPAPFVLLTRPRASSARFAALLAARWPDLEVVLAPLQEVQFLDWRQPDSKAEALIFTSQNAVEAAARAGLSGLAYCVGDQTAAAASRAGFDAISAGGDAGDLVARIRADGPKRVWHLRGRAAHGDVAGNLRVHGFQVVEAQVYQMRPLPLDPGAGAMLEAGRPVLLPLFSPKSAQRAAAVLSGFRAELRVLALSASVARAAGNLPARLRLVAKRPDADGMLEIVEEALNSGALS